MTENQNTPYSKRCEILSQLWMDYRKDEEFQDFIEYADLGLPLAYVISENIVATTPRAEEFINETFDIFVKGMGLTDTGFTSLDSLLELAKQ